MQNIFTSNKCKENLSILMLSYVKNEKSIDSYINSLCQQNLKQLYNNI